MSRSMGRLKLIEKADLPAAQTQIGEKLGFMDGRQSFHRLDFHQAPQIEFVTEALDIGGLPQAGPERPVDLDGRSDQGREQWAFSGASPRLRVEIDNSSGEKPCFNAEARGDTEKTPQYSSVEAAMRGTSDHESARYLSLNFMTQ